MTVRVPPNTMWIETFKAMGARPTTVQWSEVYNALQQNVVTGAEAPLGSLWGSKLQETRKFISLTGHFTAIVAWPINAKYFNSLPKDVQTVLLEEGAKAKDDMTQLTLDLDKDYTAKFKSAGVTIVEDVDLNAFQKATAPRLHRVPEMDAGSARHGHEDPRQLTQKAGPPGHRPPGRFLPMSNSESPRIAG